MPHFTSRPPPRCGRGRHRPRPRLHDLVALLRLRRPTHVVNRQVGQSVVVAGSFARSYDAVAQQVTCLALLSLVLRLCPARCFDSTPFSYRTLVYNNLEGSEPVRGDAMSGLRTVVFQRLFMLRAQAARGLISERERERERRASDSLFLSSTRVVSSLESRIDNPSRVALTAPGGRRAML